MTANPSTAPAAMPGEEMLRRIIEETYREPPDHAVDFAVANIMALFAPILAEKERRALNTEWHKKCATVQCERAERAEDRALAAESALAAAREEGAREATERLEGVLARYIDMVGENEGTDFIDSPGFNGPDEATLYRCSGRDERGEFTDASRANAAAIRAKEPK